MEKGQLKRWLDDRGFGFIQPMDGGQEVFIHISELKDLTRRPQIDDIVCYRTVTDKGKLRACNAFIVGARKQLTPLTVFSKAKSSFPLGKVALLSILPFIGSMYFFSLMGNPLPLVLYPVMSWVTFSLYVNDKSCAQQCQWRTPEKTLHFCELAGGWIGGFIAQKQLRHKSSKPSYQIIFWVIVGIHQFFWLVWLIFGKATMAS
jgi:uncharacterized membrane protein YsdA (DUF1294 family)/cold shock CspA family protein